MASSSPPRPVALEEFSFCLVKAKEKVPFEKGWQNKPYAHDDPKLQQHLQAGGNYGVICGYNDLMVLDVDDVAALAEVVDLSRLPPTFTAKTGGGGFHFYLKVTGGDHQKIVLKDSNGAHLGELQGAGTMVVGPGSVHPNGTTYTILNDGAVAEITREKLVGILLGAIPEERLKKVATRRRAPTSVDDDPIAGISILDVIDVSGFEESGGQYFGEHPVHGSETGHNLVVNPEKNSWWCGRCETGGGPALWLAVEAGIIDCSEARPGSLTGAKFLEVLDLARGRGLIEGKVKEPFKEVTFNDVTCVDDKDKTKFSPDKAAKAVLKAYNVISTPDDKILVYQDGIYVPGGEYVIEKALDEAAGDLANSYMKRETLAKIRLRTRVEYEDLDVDPCLFPVQNGIIDLRKGLGGFMPHDPKYKRTWKASVAFDPEATCPEIEKYLATSLDEDGRRTLIDIMAAKLTALHFPYFSPWVGRGRNGKRMATEIIRGIWGDSLITEVEVHRFHERRFDQIEVKGRHFIINNEVPRTATKGFDWVKKISGGDPITADVKGRSQVQFRPHALLIFDCNNPPRIDDYTKAIEERICPIWWNYSFVDTPSSGDPRERKRDPHLEEKITTPAELSGFLNVLLREVPRLIETRAIYRPGTGKELVESYDLKADHLAIFWDKVMTYEPGVPTSTTRAFERYCELCHTIEVSPVSQIVFNRFGRKRGFRDGRPYFTGDNGVSVRARGWYDCTLDEEELKNLFLFHGGTGLDGLGRSSDQENRYHGTDRTDIPLFNSISEYIENKGIDNNSIERSGKENPPDSFLPSPDIDSSNKTRSKTAKTRPLSGRVGKGETYTPISELQAETDRRQAEHLEHFKTPEPKPSLSGKGCNPSGGEVVASNENGRIFGLSIPYYIDLGGGQLPTVRALMNDQGWDAEKAAMAIGMLKQRRAKSS